MPRTVQQIDAELGPLRAQKDGLQERLRLLVRERDEAIARDGPPPVDQRAIALSRGRRQVVQAPRDPYVELAESVVRDAQAKERRRPWYKRLFG